VTETTLQRARSGDQVAFRELTEPYRRELQLHCYRILGSLQDAEDALQETLLSAWRALDRFEERASVRSWLYRIATNRCLNMLRDGQRRPQRGSDSELSFAPPPPTRLGEVLWLEPYPDALLDGLADAAPGPEALFETREAVSLAFIAALQRLAPRQRAVLVLRDVLGFSAAETASILETSEASVNSALIRARDSADARAVAGRERSALPSSAQAREVSGRFAEAFEDGDVEQLVSLLTDDAWMTMPPAPLEYQGIPAIAEFYTYVFTARPDQSRLVATSANGQPAFGHYLKDPSAPVARASGILVLTFAGARISRIDRFPAGGVIGHFGLPRTIPW
jgi:RNA polymerase sigma-70 factor (ECF subfamily)